MLWETILAPSKKMEFVWEEKSIFVCRPRIVYWEEGREVLPCVSWLPIHVSLESLTFSWLSYKVTNDVSFNSFSSSFNLLNQFLHDLYYRSFSSSHDWWFPPWSIEYCGWEIRRLLENQQLLMDHQAMDSFWMQSQEEGRATSLSFNPLKFPCLFQM